ncbi:MAG: histidine kinase [Muribaculaceae bacterium]|nr:histidine kinase [Muribaculaceae bacterium]
MKSTEKISKLTLLLNMTIVMVMLLSCRENKTETVMPSEIADITDALRNGNMTQAMSMTDELKSKAIAMGDSGLWSEAMVQQGVNSYYQGNPAGVLSSADSAICWLERQKHFPSKARILAKAYQTKGAYYDQYHFNSDSTALYFRKAVDQVELSGIHSDLPQAYGNYANALRMGAALDSAALYYHRAISTADSLDLETIHYIPLYNGIASVFTDMRDFENSAIWWSKSMQVLESMNQFDKFNTLTGVGNDHYYKNDYDGAEQIFTRLRKMLDSVPGAEWETMFTEVNLSDTYIRIGRIQEAQEILNKAANYFTKEQPNPTVMSYIQTLRMRAATAMGDYAGGLEMAQQYPESDTLRLEQHLARLKAMEDLYSNIGNHRLAYITRCRYDHLNDSLRSYRLSQQISALNAIYQRDHRILNLEAGNTRQQAHIYKLTAGIAIALAVIAGLILIYVVRRINSKKREERMMNKIISLRQENLRNRVTPHFIYNALNHELNNERIGHPSHLDSLVDLIRRQQIVASEILIPFSEELKFTDDYIRVISDNGRDPFVYNYSIDPDIDPNFAFPSMTLQILVENAFKHGFTTLPAETERRLIITVKRLKEGIIAVNVFNNCGPSPSGMEKGGTGLRVLLETIKLINEHNRQQTNFSIDTKAELNGIHGCNATITLPDNLKP